MTWLPRSSYTTGSQALLSLELSGGPRIIQIAMFLPRVFLFNNRSGAGSENLHFDKFPSDANASDLWATF